MPKSKKGKFECELCNIKYTTKYEYNRHLNSKKHKLKTDNPIFKYNCGRCQYSTDDEETWEMHLSGVIHAMSEEKMLQRLTKKYYCEICDCTILYSNNYKKHLETKQHIEAAGKGKFKYNCNKCDFNTNSNTSWQSHLKSDKHNLSEKEYSSKIKASAKNNTPKGDILEEYVLHILKKSRKLQFTERIGQTYNKFDIIFKLK